MTLSQLADVADLFAGIGVIGSLIFVAYELRISNQETKLANWRQVLDSFREYKATTNDLKFAEMVERGHKSYSNLSDAEKRSFGQFLEQGIHVIGNITKHQGRMPTDLKGLQQAADNSMLDLMHSPGAREWWAEYKPKGKLMPKTFKTIDGILDKADNGKM